MIKKMGKVVGAQAAVRAVREAVIPPISRLGGVL